MTLQEFSTTFDVLWNNATSNQAPGINEYEKSVFLTKAQSQLVNEYFNNRTDGFGGGFDGSQRRQYDFSGLIRTERLFRVNTFKSNRIAESEKLDRRSKVYLFPKNYFLAVNEILSDEKWQYSVIPLSYGEYQRVMTKPYNFPPKRAAWRIFTDKKNCNVWEGTVDTAGNIHVPGAIDSAEEFTDDSPALTPVTYSFQSSWADKKRNLQITIGTCAWVTSAAHPDEFDITSLPAYAADKYESFEFTYPGDEGECKAAIICSKKTTNWTDDGLTYQIDLIVTCEDKDTYGDDESVIKILQYGFDTMNKSSIIGFDDLNTVMKRTDGFKMCEAPSKFYKFGGMTSVGTISDYTFTTHVVPIPMAEVIGKFVGTPEYQLRYIKNLTPIILEDLTNYGQDITIDGITAATECALPVETHQEILERAVTLAKIAWQGGTLSQAQAQQRDNRE